MIIDSPARVRTLERIERGQNPRLCVYRPSTLDAKQDLQWLTNEPAKLARGSAAKSTTPLGQRRPPRSFSQELLLGERLLAHGAGVGSSCEQERKNGHVVLEVSLGERKHLIEDEIGKAFR
jgi:hypothetical protein